MESHGRDADLASELDLTRTIGWFTSQYPVIVELTDVENRESCRVAARTALDDIELSGLGYDSGSGVGTLPGLALNYLGQLDRAIPAGKLFRPTSTLRAGIDPLNHRPHDVGVVAWLSGGELHVILDAASSAVSQTELNQLGESLRDLLSPAVITTGTVDDATLGALGSILDELDL
jgi:hypothetical protein